MKVNEAKTRLVKRTQRQRVTGLVVNEKVNVSRDYVRGLRGLLFVWKHHGQPAAEAALARRGDRNWPPGKAPPDFRLAVRGRVQHVGAVKGWDNSVYVKLALKLQSLDARFVPRSSAPRVGSRMVRLYTEGVTDGLLMTAAAAYFASRGEFTNFSLVPTEVEGGKGDKGLLKLLRSVKPREDQPSVVLFDRDNPDVLWDAVANSAWHNWGNGVTAVAIALPPWRPNSEPACIEMLFTDGVLTRETDDGRRIFLRSEFDQVTGLDSRHFYTSPEISKGTLVRDSVYEIGTSRSVALGKKAFAEAVANGDPPFDSLDFEGFRPTFELIATAVAEASADLTRTRPPVSS